MICHAKKDCKGWITLKFSRFDATGRWIECSRCTYQRVLNDDEFMRYIRKLEHRSQLLETGFEELDELARKVKKLESAHDWTLVRLAKEQARAERLKNELEKAMRSKPSFWSTYPSSSSSIGTATANRVLRRLLRDVHPDRHPSGMTREQVHEVFVAISNARDELK